MIGSTESAEHSQFSDHVTYVLTTHIVGAAAGTHMFQHGLACGEIAEWQFVAFAFGCFDKKIFHTTESGFTFAHDPFVFDHQT